jgi:hypothetical protein
MTDANEAGVIADLFDAEKATEPKKPQKRAPFPKPPPASASPIFVARFADGVETRVSIYSALDPLDVERGITIAKAAYSSRTRTPMAAAPAFLEAHFDDRDGVLLASYTAEQLNGGKKKEGAV